MEEERGESSASVESTEAPPTAVTTEIQRPAGYIIWTYLMKNLPEFRLYNALRQRVCIIICIYTYINLVYTGL